MANLNRRQLIHGLVAVAGASAATAVTTQHTPSSQDAPAVSPPVTSQARELPALFRTLPVGTVLGRWRIAEVHPLTMGGIPVVLESLAADGPEESRRFQVDVLRRDREPDAHVAIAETEHHAIFLANVPRGDGTHGSTATPEAQGLGAMALADALRAREDGTTAAGLYTLRVRTQRFPRGVFGVLPRA